jgi:hypothetical protein
MTSRSPGAVDWFAPADISNGLPLPPTELPVRWAPATDVEDGSNIRLGRETSGVRLVGRDADASVEVARPLKVEVERSPVTMVEGPITMGTTTCSVFPFLSVVVLVKVERIVLVGSAAASLGFDVLCLVVVGVGARVDREDSSSESAAAP